MSSDWRKKGSLYVPRPFSIRERRPPPPVFGVGIQGWMEWELFDLNLGRVVDGGQQSNLVLDQGLEQMASYGMLGLQNYGAVGTGSTAPAMTDTALVAEVARSNSNGGIGDSLAQTANGVYQKTVTREFTEAQVGGQNLTEWGFSPIATSPGNLAVRELFRDGSNNPITISPTATQRLRVYYTQEYQLTPTVATAVSFSITNDAGSPRSGQFLWTDGNANKDLYVANGFMKGANPFGNTQFRSWSTGSTSHPALTYHQGGVGAGTMTIPASRTWGGYTAGSYTRSIQFFWDTSVGNWEHGWYAIGDTSYSSTIPGVVFGFDTGQGITKDNLHQLTIDPVWTVTWSRV